MKDKKVYRDLSYVIQQLRNSKTATYNSELRKVERELSNLPTLTEI
ncbi:hypothetical protein CAJAP_02288 [Camponotus japonicus]